MQLTKLTSLLATSAAAGLLLAAAGAAPAVAQDKTLIIGAVFTPESLDGDINLPGTQNTVVQTYEGITKYGRTKNAAGEEILDSAVILPHLADSWSVSPDGKEVTFKLRRGVKGPTGNEMSADDWVWSWDKSFSQKRTGNFIARVSNVTTSGGGVEKIDDYTVKFHLDGPSSILLKAITLYTPSIYDSKITKDQATADDPFATKWILKNTAGFGAYHMSELKPGEQAVFTANPNYFGDKPYFDRVVYRMVPSGASRLTLLRAGQIHIAENMTAQQLNELKKDKNVKVRVFPGRSVAAVRMNSKIAPFDDVRVRQAFNFATNKQTLIDTVFLGEGEPARSFVATFIDGGLTGAEPYPYDPAKAKALLADAGYPNGLDVELNYSDINEWEEPMAIQMQNILKASNIRVTPKRMTGSDMRARSHIKVQDIPFFTYEDGPIVLDSVYAAYLIAHGTGGVSNRTNLNIPRINQLIDQARVELDQEKALGMMDELQKIWVEEAPWILTTFRPIGEAFTPKLKGFVSYPDNHERWSDLRFE